MKGWSEENGIHEGDARAEPEGEAARPIGRRPGAGVPVTVALSCRYGRPDNHRTTSDGELIL